jgi:hypothetical protein
VEVQGADGIPENFSLGFFYPSMMMLTARNVEKTRKLRLNGLKEAVKQKQTNITNTLIAESRRRNVLLLFRA